MNNADMPAAPLADPEIYADPARPELGTVVANGLSKREHLAAMAMQGFLANPAREDSGIEDEAEWAVRAADALLAELERTS